VDTEAEPKVLASDGSPDQGWLQRTPRVRYIKVRV
jgi:hypothetical protein